MWFGIGIVVGVVATLATLSVMVIIRERQYDRLPPDRP